MLKYYSKMPITDKFSFERLLRAYISVRNYTCAKVYMAYRGVLSFFVELSFLCVFYSILLYLLKLCAVFHCLCPVLCKIVFQSKVPCIAFQNQHFYKHFETNLRYNCCKHTRPLLRKSAMGLCPLPKQEEGTVPAQMELKLSEFLSVAHSGGHENNFFEYPLQ